MVGAAVVLALGIATWWITRSGNESTARCPTGLQVQGARCCGAGQYFEAGRCVGRAAACAASMQLQRTRGSSECVAREQRVRIAGGHLTLSPSDWEAEGQLTAREVEVAPFEIDTTEYTVGRYRRCASSGHCSGVRLDAKLEAGLPLGDVSAQQAQSLCESEGGRLPSGDEWLFAAAGPEARRFPWGNTGLVCRRAVFGMVAGPCTEGASGPELAGARPDGATPEGIFDLSGNLAEWTREPQGYLVRGGSFASTLAGMLKSWAAAPAPERSPTIGFRCAYPAR